MAVSHGRSLFMACYLTASRGLLASHPTGGRPYRPPGQLMRLHPRLRLHRNEPYFMTLCRWPISSVHPHSGYRSAYDGRAQMVRQPARLQRTSHLVCEYFSKASQGAASCDYSTKCAEFAPSLTGGLLTILVNEEPRWPKSAAGQVYAREED